MAEEMGMMQEPDMAAAQQNLMSSDPDIQTVLMSRITQMTPEELQALDSAISPNVEMALLKLLPELKELIDAINQQGEEMPEDMENMDESGMPKEMGALGNM